MLITELLGLVLNSYEIIEKEWFIGRMEFIEKTWFMRGITVDRGDHH